jgi:creatine kinase
MRHNTLGILAMCPSNVGTGLRASVKIKIPKLIAHRNYLHSICATYHLTIRGEDGEGTSSSSNILDISNKETIGSTETELVQKLIKGITKIIQEEKTL